MTKDMSMRLHRIFNIVLCAFILLSGALLSAGCLYIYFGVGEYTRETVAGVFTYMAVPVWVCLALIVAGWVWEIVSPLKAKKEKPLRDNANIRKKLLLKKDLEGCGGDLERAVRAEQKKRLWVAIVRGALVLFSAVALLAFSLNPETFYKEEINDSVIGVMTLLCPLLFLCAGFSVFTIFFCEKSLEKEISLLKKIPDKKGENEEKTRNEKIAKTLWAVGKIAILAIAVLCLVYGAVEGGFSDVMTKAVNICTECIGLG